MKGKKKSGGIERDFEIFENPLGILRNNGIHRKGELSGGVLEKRKRRLIAKTLELRQRRVSA